jgi:hypothetical protein
MNPNRDPVVREIAAHATATLKATFRTTIFFLPETCSRKSAMMTTKRKKMTTSRRRNSGELNVDRPRAGAIEIIDRETKGIVAEDVHRAVVPRSRPMTKPRTNKRVLVRAATRARIATRTHPRDPVEAGGALDSVVANRVRRGANPVHSAAKSLIRRTRRANCHHQLEVGADANADEAETINPRFGMIVPPTTAVTTLEAIYSTMNSSMKTWISKCARILRLLTRMMPHVHVVVAAVDVVDEARARLATRRVRVMTPNAMNRRPCETKSPLRRSMMTMKTTRKSLKFVVNGRARETAKVETSRASEVPATGAIEFGTQKTAKSRDAAMFRRGWKRSMSWSTPISKTTNDRDAAAGAVVVVDEVAEANAEVSAQLPPACGVRGSRGSVKADETFSRTHANRTTWLDSLRQGFSRNESSPKLRWSDAPNDW